MTTITGNIETDFEQVLEGGGRCACCNRMQAREVHLFYVDDSAHFFKADGYTRLAYTAKQSHSLTGWCKECIEKTKQINDNFQIPEGN